MSDAANLDAANPNQAPATQPGRNAKGQFAPGNPGGPGRPPKVEYIEREIVAIMASALNAETWFEIAEAVIKKAREGNMTAVQWLSRTFLTGRLNEAAAAEEVLLPPDIEMYELGRKQHREWKRHMDKKRAEAEKTAQEAARLEASRAASRSSEERQPLAGQRSAPAATVSRTTPAQDRVVGFRVTKSASAANGPNRANTEKNASPPGPCAAG